MDWAFILKDGEGRGLILPLLLPATRVLGVAGVFLSSIFLHPMLSSSGVFFSKGVLQCLAIAVRTVWINGGGVLLPALSNQLVKTVTQVLDLTRAQDTGHPHQLPMAPTTTATVVDMATTP